MSEGWQSLKSVIEESRADAAAYRQLPLVDCPLCGAVLDRNSRGEFSCPQGHFRAPAGALRSQYGV